MGMVARPNDWIKKRSEVGKVAELAIVVGSGRDEKFQRTNDPQVATYALVNHWINGNFGGQMYWEIHECQRTDAPAGAR